MANVPLCTFKGECYWQHKCHTRKGKEYKVCRMVKKFPNETCNQLKIVTHSELQAHIAMAEKKTVRKL